MIEEFRIAQDVKRIFNLNKELDNYSEVLSALENIAKADEQYFNKLLHIRETVSSLYLGE